MQKGKTYVQTYKEDCTRGLGMYLQADSFSILSASSLQGSPSRGVWSGSKD